MAHPGDRVSWEDDAGKRQVSTLVDYIPEVNVVLLRNDHGAYFMLEAARVEKPEEYWVEGR